MGKLESLWQGAQYQESLLQSYRNYHLTTQSILVAIGAGLSVSIFTFERQFDILGMYTLLVVISLLALYLLNKLRKLIRARAEDVDYFHNQIIEVEKNLSKKEKTMTAFKVYQKFNRQKVDINEYFEKFELTDNILNQLTEKGKGHTRKVLDTNLFKWFYFVWISFHLVGLTKIYETIIN